MNKYDFAKRELPKLIDQRLRELRKKDRNATYEAAFRQIARELADVYEDYTASIAMDGNL